MKISWDNRFNTLQLLPHRFQVMCAVFYARQVEHLFNKKALEAVVCAERWLEGKATAEECRAAANAAVYTAYTAAAEAANAAAYAAAYAAYTAAYAANAAAAHNAHTAAAYAAANAAYAYDAEEEIKEEQVVYLRYLYLQSLPEEQRNCWLVNACI